MNNFNKNLDELIQLISNQEEVKRYKLIEQKLNENDYVKNKITDFKKLQQKMAIYESKNNTIPDIVNDEYNKLYNELMDIPIFNEYINLQQEINDFIKQITHIIEKEINNK